MNREHVGWWGLLAFTLVPWLVLGDAAGDPITDELRELPALQKLHVSWPVDATLLNCAARLTEYVRITGACSVGLGAPEADWLKCIGACESGGGRLVVKYSPLRSAPLPDESPAERANAFDARFTAELCEIMTQLEGLEAIVDAGGVELAVILLDSESHIVTDETRQALVEKHTAVYRLFKDAFPTARIVWYNVGGIREAGTPEGWNEFPKVPIEIPVDNAFSCSLYALPEIHRMRETFRRTLANAELHGVGEVVPWVALGCGWERTPWRPPPGRKVRRWCDTCDYPLAYSWQLGAELNRPWYSTRPMQYAPWSAAPIVAFWPQAGDTGVPAWWRHFIAYVRGAHNRALEGGGP